MKISIKIYFLLVVAAVNLFGCTATTKEFPIQQDPSSPNFVAPKPKEWRLENGMQVLFLEDTELPLVYGTLYLPGGTYWQGGNEMGSVASMGQLLREGGTQKLSPDELDSKLDNLAAGISSGFSQEWGKVSFSGLARDTDTLFGMFADVVLKPRFDEKRLNLWKGNNINSIRRRKENPGDVAQIAFQQILYGETPYGRVSSVSDIEKLSRTDVIRQYNRFVKPGRAVLTIGGSISEAKARELILKHFGAWKGQPDLPPLPEITTEPSPGIYFITLPVSQASIFMGQLGVPRLTPDYPAIDSFNEIFGSSGFGLARLFVKIRTELGLAYQVYGAIRSGVKRGTNTILIQTKSESADEAVVEAMKVLKGIQESGVNKTELEEVKHSVENSFVFNFATTSNILDRRASIKMLGFPDDFDQTYVSKIRDTSTEQIQEVAQKRWDLSKFVFVVVGNEDAYAELERRLKDNPDLLAGRSLKKIGFDQKIVW